MRLTAKTALTCPSDLGTMRRSHVRQPAEVLAMSLTGAFSATTFKPYLDKWVATDGVDVVIAADSREVLLLRFLDDHWRMTRHAAVDAATHRDALDEGFYWLGVRYCSRGSTLARFDEQTPMSAWERAYAACFSAGAAPLITGGELASV